MKEKMKKGLIRKNGELLEQREYTEEELDQISGGQAGYPSGVGTDDVGIAKDHPGTLGSNPVGTNPVGTGTIGTNPMGTGTMGAGTP